MPRVVHEPTRTPRRHDLELLRGGEMPLNLAARVTLASGCPLVGGFAVYVHVHHKTTRDIDIYTEDFSAAHERLSSRKF